MFTVALVGGDGAGKTTIAKSLEQSSQLRIKYLYNGVSTRSSNRALPTSHLVLFFKQRSYRKLAQSKKIESDNMPASYLEYGQVQRGPLWTSARLLNRFAEAWYRQLIAFAFQLRGYVVVYDRHILFDSAIGTASSQGREQQRLDHLYHWILTYMYPKPDLSIFLDAPGEVLYERKREATPEYLNRQRETYLAQGKKLRNFVRVDATQPLNQVLAEVTQRIMDFSVSRQDREPDDDPRQVLNDKQSS